MGSLNISIPIMEDIKMPVLKLKSNFSFEIVDFESCVGYLKRSSVVHYRLLK